MDQIAKKRRRKTLILSPKIRRSNTKKECIGIKVQRSAPPPPLPLGMLCILGLKSLKAGIEAGSSTNTNSFFDPCLYFFNVSEC